MTVFTDQTVLVTGAGRGLGAAIARAFAREGAKVAINYRKSEQAAQALAAELGANAAAFQADVTDPGAVAGMVAAITDRFGAPDVLVHNALADFQFNGDARKGLDTMEWADIAHQAETAVGGALNLIRALRPHFAERGAGRVVTIGTNLVQNPVVPYHDYTAAKAALLALTRTAARDLGPLGVTVNMVSGGLLRVTDASAATPDAVFDLIAQQTPLGQVTTPEELADAVLFFASPWARAVTGQNLIVDGGLVSG
ncbi:3-oxoacyl-ACP reductase [Lutimaribacter sp. EGI FJ00015]|uniref:3-oxoacyl-ACP reductase n=1 Tax=Lutimaribacter degradans TaxID=2945989 RepID=A0ACC5ZXS1_9RHOB|nr:3-oxoacyl-ACP reductase [Lutimaribacter sp. EGI FJ00013]MCM2562344.1 3-oxoacyl-ACP reductase [Lutimaribacter sp. EGI FJ00013]MCO0613499.1 3-oxoacyl-ACP reductase [Lutimaribacter sp. EGI FJ00015]MCO0636473.1 3-oxoacyl-ACP reductase [Lutimaribacter sp. EGI FJ00014]